MKRRILILSIFLAGTSTSFVCRRRRTYGGATEMTQLANNTELVNILGQEYEQVANQGKTDKLSGASGRRTCAPGNAADGQDHHSH